MTGRFVILYHQMPAASARASHWDLMLEQGSALRTWALETEPRPDSVIRGDGLDDHRLAYLDLEGPIAGDRGTVTRIDRGDYVTVSRDSHQWRVRLAGSHLRCELHVDRSATDQRWSFTFGGNPAAAVVGTGG